MDAIAGARATEFISTYVHSNYLDPSSDPQHRAAMEQSLAELRLVSDDLARVDAMLDEIASHRAFIHWMTGRIQEAEQRGEDSYLLRWDRGFAGAKIREMELRLPELLGPSLEARLVNSRETFRLRYLDSGALGQASHWAGDDPAIQEALDGMLIPDSAQAVVNQYLYSIGRLQRDSAFLAEALAQGGTLSRSPRRQQYALTLSDWQQQAATHAQTVMGILSGTIDAFRVDPVPWSERTSVTVTSRPPATAAERKAFHWAEDTAWLLSLGKEARALEQALTALDTQRRKSGGVRAQTAEEVRDQSQRRYLLVQKARLVGECMDVARARLQTLRMTGSAGEDLLRPVDLDRADAQRKLDAFNRRTPVSSTQTPSPVSPDEAVFAQMLPFLEAQQLPLERSQEAMTGLIDRLSWALEVPTGFTLDETQRAELGLLRSQRAALLEQRQLGRQEQTALKVLMDRTALAQRRGDPFDHGAFSELYAAWEAAKAARLQGQEARHGALMTPPPEFVAWKQSVRSSLSRAQTVTSSYLLTLEANAEVRAQIAADRQDSIDLRKTLQAQDAAIKAANARMVLLTRPGASAADKADAASAQARLNALQSLRSAQVNRLLLVERRLADGEALRTSNSAGGVEQRQQAIARTSGALPDAWLEQLRSARPLAQADLAVAQRNLTRLQGTTGTPNTLLMEAQRLLAYRERASAYATARVVAQEAERGIRSQTTPLETARQALASTREAMQAAYFDLVQLRLVYRTDSLHSQLRAAQRRNASIDELLQLQKEISATEIAWPRDVVPYPNTPEAKAAAVQARHGDDLPE